MRVLTIRNIPDHIYNLLGTLAKENRRSLQQQALTLLEQTALFLNNSKGSLDKALSIRESLKNRDLGNTLKELKEDRNR